MKRFEILLYYLVSVVLLSGVVGVVGYSMGWDDGYEYLAESYEVSYNIHWQMITELSAENDKNILLIKDRGAEIKHLLSRNSTVKEVIKEVEKIVEVEKVVYRNIYSREWQSVEEFTEWYQAQDFSVLMPSGDYQVDCDDYAGQVRVRALEQGYSISDALTWYGRYYNQKVTDLYLPDVPGHTGSLVEIDGVFYYFEPMPEEWNGLKIITIRD